MKAHLSRSLSPKSAKRKVMQPGHRSFRALVLFAVALPFLAVAPAAAHAILLESSPALKSAVTGPDVPIKLRFNVRIDALRSRLTLIHPDGSSQALQITKQPAPPRLSPHAPCFSPALSPPPSPPTSPP